MPVKLNSSGGGSVTLDVPATGTNTTLTLPITGGGVAASGAIGSSGLTMNTSRLLGRTTASSGAVEEITVGTGLSLTGGTLATSGGSQLQEQLFTASGSWTAPTGVTRVYVVVVGGGGGAGGGAGPCNPGGGSGGFGGVSVGIMTVVPGTAYTVTVGSGGSGGVTGTNGVAGNTSSFGALMSATGGARGLAAGSGNGLPGSGTGGTLRNLNMSSSPISPFYGFGFRPGGTTAVVWSTSLANSPGAGGAPDSTTNGPGGVNGIVYLQWVG